MFNQVRRSFRILFLIAIFFLLASCASNKVKENQHFPEPKSMEPMVTFWENVYSKWDSHQAVFHDDTYMDVVYEIVDISSIGESNERSYLRSYKERMIDALDEFERSYQAKLPLTDVQKKWEAMLKKSGNPQAFIGISERLRYQRGLKTRFKRGVEESGQYLPYFKELFKKEGLPIEIAYLPHVESSFQNHARSSVGAAGMWQFMPATARSFLPMQRNVVDGRFDPFIAARGAASYLKQSYQRVNSWPLALTSYNHGLGGMLNAKEQMGTTDIERIVWDYKGARFKFASRNFYAEFVAAKRIAENPSHYFPGIQHHKALSVDGIKLLSPMRLAELSLKTGIDQNTLIRLNPAWLRNIHNNKADIPAYMEIWLPKDTVKTLPSNLMQVIWKS